VKWGEVRKRFDDPRFDIIDPQEKEELFRMFQRQLRTEMKGREKRRKKKKLKKEKRRSLGAHGGRSRNDSAKSGNNDVLGDEIEGEGDDRDAEVEGGEEGPEGGDTTEGHEESEGGGGGEPGSEERMEDVSVRRNTRSCCMALFSVRFFLNLCFMFWVFFCVERNILRSDRSIVRLSVL
jgi:hypothetical protein